MDHCKRSQGSVWIPVLFICCLPVGRRQALRKSCEAVCRNCSLSRLSAMLIVSGICKVDPSGKGFLWQDRRNWCSTRIIWWTGQGGGMDKREKIQRKRKNKQSHKQLPLVLITLASVDHPGSCLEWLLLQRYTLCGTPKMACSSVIPHQAGASPAQRCASVSPWHWVVCVWGMPSTKCVFGVYYLQTWAARWFGSTLPVHISCISDKARKGQKGTWTVCGRSEEEMLLGKGELGWASRCITHADGSLRQPLKHTVSEK